MKTYDRDITWDTFPGPPIECMWGPHAHSNFLGKGGIFGRTLGKISRENPEKGCFFVTANSNICPR